MTSDHYFIAKPSAWPLITALGLFLLLGGFGLLLHGETMIPSLLGAVVLAVTGSETLYADMGHFGSRPIRLAWFGCVLPSLLINYFGQGALLLHQPNEVTEPFFHLAPAWALYPLIVLATVATVMSS